ncbi:MAG: peptidylprolyl isomerase [Clostridia bacterium]|nr:peptidylprolyl isomerase [Clostridia bacterium]
MNSKTKKLKTGNENSVIVIILAVLLVVVLGIVGVIVAKDNQGIATFDGGKVTKAEYKVYYQMFASYLQMYGYSQDEIPGEIADKAALDKMILTDAKAAGVELTEENKTELDTIFNDEEYIEYFQSLGFDLDDLREIYQNDYIIQNYIQKLADEATAEVMTTYITSKYEEGETIDMNEYDTSHILFSFTDESGNTLDDAAKATLKTEAEAVLARALAGEDFATLVGEYSDDTGTAANGGQYTVYMDGYTVDEYADAVTTMQVGEIKAALVETTYGYHIIKLNAKTENGRVNNTTEREEYANSLFGEEYITAKNKVVDEELLVEFVKEIDPDAYTEESTETATDTTTSTDGTTTVTVE